MTTTPMQVRPVSTSQARRGTPVALTLLIEKLPAYAMPHFRTLKM
jgi:hypothetical protein